MSPASVISPTGRINKGSGCQIMSHERSGDNTDLLQADLTGASLSVFDLDGDQTTPVSGPTALTIANVVFDTLQTDARWDTDIDPGGYNFRYEIPEAAFPIGGRRYRAEVTFDPTSGEDWVTKWLIAVDNTLS